MTDWLTVERGDVPLIVSVPHAGTDIPKDIAARLASVDLARKDADFYVDRLYAFAGDLGATVVRTAISRSVIDVNRDPSGRSLYPGQAVTGLCPLTTFDGEALYRTTQDPGGPEIYRRREAYFAPYHAAIAAEIARLRSLHDSVVLYDAHSIRSHVARLFDGKLPQFNIGTNDGQSCALALTRAVENISDAGGRSRVTDGRFKGGWITRHYGRPDEGVHAIQMELAIRGYADEQSAGWPPRWDADYAAPLQQTLRDILIGCLDFAKESA